MEDHMLIAAGQGRDDRLSRLSDDVLGHILSFLDAKEAGRAATLSSPWRDVFASVHTVSIHLDGHVLHADPAAAMATTCTILRRAPGLELLILVFGPAPLDLSSDGPDSYRRLKERDLLDAHHLHYNPHQNLDYETAAIPPCLESRLRRIFLVHYQGGRAQRTLVRFLLRNTPRLEKLCCRFAEGHLWVQTELMREMEGWVVNDGASKEFC